MHSILKRYLYWCGSALAILGIIFVALRLRDYGTEIKYARFGLAAWSALFSFALIYGLANMMLALAWWNLLGHFGTKFSRSWAVRTYGISQIARYVPGNIFHLASRQVMGIADGISGWLLAKSAVWELGLISTAGGVFALLSLPFLVPSLSIMVSAGIFVAVICIVMILQWSYIGRSIFRAFAWYTVFLAISGLLFVGLIELLVERSGSGAGFWLQLSGAYVLAWLVGLVTPGAPAGVGVRELVLMFLLKGVVDEVDLLLVVVLGRLVTVAGDLFFFAASTLIIKGNLNA